MSTLISTFHFRLHNYADYLSNVLSFLEVLKPSCETYNVENIKSTNFILVQAQNLRIHELVILNQTTKIDTHEEKYFHSNCFHYNRDKCG
jgi:hypothetical protein